MLEILPEFLTNNNQHTEIEGKCIEDHVSEMRGINISDQPTPVIDATHNYLQSFFVDTLPTNLIQAIRDSFGAHGVKRIGSESNESFRWK